MEKFKEFQGKDLDECISEACSYYDLPREKLEIEIIQDAKSGIFGIVLARKAKIRAKRAELPEPGRQLAQGESRSAAKKPQRETQSVERPQNGPAEYQRRENADVYNKPYNQSAVNRPWKRNNYKPSWQKPRPGEALAPARNAAPRHAGEENSLSAEQEAASQAPENREFREKRNFDARERYRPEYARPNNRWNGRYESRYESYDDHFDDFPADEYTENEALVLKKLDSGEIEKNTREIVTRLVTPIAGREINMSVDLAHGGICAKVDWEGDAGLLIGREGQTLNALQYLASRMISHVMNAQLRIHLDIGEYRSRQDEKLREIAFALAERARQSGRSQATRPLSSYQRRVIHLCLQNEPEVETKSSGDGPLKRVIIFPHARAER